MMHILKQLSQSIGFTPAERRVALVLLATFLVGIGVKMYRVYADPAPAFEYAAEDSAFARASRAPVAADTLIAPRDIPTRSSTAGPAAASRTRGARKKELPPRSVHINTARKEDFMLLPGIGETMAERIIEYRRDHGPFSTLEELMNVKGIGKKKFERIAPSCTLGK